MTMALSTNDDIDPVISVKPYTEMGGNCYIGEQQSGNSLCFRVESDGCVLVSSDGGGDRLIVSKLVIPQGFTIDGEFFKSKAVGKEFVSSINTIKEVIIPEGVQIIEEYAFFGSSISRVVFPSTLEVIESSAFYRTQLSSVAFPESVRIIGDCSFCACKDLKKIVLNEGLLSIGMMAFAGSKILEVDVPQSVTRMDSNAFPEKTVIRFHGAPPRIDNELEMNGMEYVICVKRENEYLFKKDLFWKDIRVIIF